MGRFVIKSLFSGVSGIGAVLFWLICVPGIHRELSQIAADAEAASQSATGVSVTTAGNALSNTLTLQAELAQAGVTMGSPVYLRIFKSNGKDGAFRTIGSVQGEWEERWIPNLKRAWVELWMQGKDGSYQLLKSYPVCTYTGNLGPKRVADDKQAPEGFYTIQSAGMNPNSAYYRSMDIGYPNAYDRLQHATGSQIKIHGMCISGGCFTMGEPQREEHQHMEELYTLVKAAHAEGQTQVPVHIFPFPMTEENLDLHANSNWIQFWTLLKPAYDLFERDHIPPQVHLLDGEYVITPGLLQSRDRL
jgi:murein L,D-transpeptidase YafK